MKVAFRQGIVSHQSSAFLNYNKTTGKVDLRAEDRPVVVTIAHQYTDYIFSEDLSIDSAWIGPFEKGIDYWLFWDFDISDFGGACPPNYHSKFTCKRKFLHTDLMPIVSDIAPVDPATWQMWYDKKNHKHYEWNGVDWVEKLRVFACKLDTLSHIIPLSIVIQKGFGDDVTNISKVSPSFIGTQIGDNTEVFAGRPLYTEQGNVIARDDGTFFTTEDQFFADKSRVDALRLESNVHRAQSMAPALDAFSVVAWDQIGSAPGAEDGRIRAATYDDTAFSVIGVLTESIMIGEIGAVIIEGSITNPKWNWLESGLIKVGHPLWVADGRLIAKNPNKLDPSKYPQERPAVARVLANDNIVFQQGITGVYDLGELDEDELNLPPASTNDLGVVRLSTPPGSAGTPIIDGSTEFEPIAVETTDPRLSDKRNPKHHFHNATEVVLSGHPPALNVQEGFDNIEDAYVERIGDAMTGALILNIDDPSYPRNPNDAVPKKYVDKLTTGLLWQEPIAFPNLVSINSAQEPQELPAVGDVHVVSSVPIGWAGFSPGNVVQYVGSEGWKLVTDNLDEMIVNGFPDRFGVCMSSDTVPEGDLVKNSIIDRFGTVIFDPADPNNNPPPSPAVSVTSRDYPSGLENIYALFSYAWNGERWIVTAGDSINFANWIHGNSGIKFEGADPESTAKNSAAIGSRALASGNNSISFGTESIANGEGSISIGKRSNTQEVDTIAIGTNASSAAKGSISIGSNIDDSLNIKSILIGHGASASADGEIFIGNYGTVDINDSYLRIIDGAATIEGTNKQIVIPGHPNTSQINVVAVDGGSMIYNKTTGTIWYYNDNGSPGEWKELSAFINWIHANNGLNFTTSPVAHAPNAIASGNNSSTLSINSISMGSDNTIESGAENAISIGTSNIIQLGAEGSVSIGTEIGTNTINRPITQPNAISIGTQAAAIGKDSIAIGFQTIAQRHPSDPDASASIAIGDKCIAGYGSVVIGSNSIYAPNETAPFNTVVLGTRTYTNRHNTIVIGDGCYIDTTRVSEPLHNYQGEFIKIGGSAGSDMFCMMLGDPGDLDGLGYPYGGQFKLYAPHAQFVLPSYNPNEYYSDNEGPGIHPLTGLPIVEPLRIYSKPGGLIYDLKHVAHYDVSIPGPGDPGDLPTEQRVKIFDETADDWRPLGAKYLYDLADVYVDYLGSEIEEGAALVFENGVWTPGHAVGGGGGSYINVPLSDIDPALDLETLPIGIPMYFDVDDENWKIAHADDPTTVHTAIFSKNTGVAALITLSGEVGNIDISLNNDVPLVAGLYYYLSTSTNSADYGEITSVRPTDDSIIAPVWQALGDDKVLVLPYRAGSKGEGSGGGGGGGGGIITVPNSDFYSLPAIGAPVYFDGTVWKVAQADNIYTVHTCVFAGESSGVSTLVITGEVSDINNSVNNGESLIPGYYYYLSVDEPGKITKDKPVSPYIVAPVWQALDPSEGGTDRAFVLPYRAGSAPVVIRGRSDFTSIGDETTFAISYTPGNLDAYLNGTLLHPTDFNATDGISVVLSNPTDVGDTITFISQSESAVVPGSPTGGINIIRGSWTGIAGPALPDWPHNNTSGYLQVFKNGLLLDESAYITDGTQILLSTDLQPTDVVNAISTITTGDPEGSSVQLEPSIQEKSSMQSEIEILRKQIDDLTKELKLMGREL